MDEGLLHLNRYKPISNKLINIKSHKNKTFQKGNISKKPTKNSGRGTAIIVM
ncbi:hypothetical protein PPNK14_35100 [Pectobacterium parmentieri]